MCYARCMDELLRKCSSCETPTPALFDVTVGKAKLRVCPRCYRGRRTQHVRAIRPLQGFERRVVVPEAFN